MIKAIIFDCFGVLTADTWKEFVEALPASEREEASSLNRAYDVGQISRKEFLQAVHDITGLPTAKFEQTFDNETTKNYELLSYIGGLKPRYKIGLLSNVASNWIREVLLTTAEQALFDNFIMSFETGFSKPDPRMFQLVAKDLGVLPEECVMVDDIEAYCVAARNSGMPAICYKSFEQFKVELERLLANTKD